ncbi:hypothetical protein Tco_0006426 [Tanacetum coccineum]
MLYDGNVIKNTSAIVIPDSKETLMLAEESPLKDDLRKLKGKTLVDNAVTKHTIDSEMLKIDVEPITPKLSSKLFSVKFRNDHMEKIMGYGDYQIGNVTISRVYYVEGLGHNLFSVGQLCDSNLEVAFHQHTCFIRNLEGVDLLTGSRGNNLYTLFLWKLCWRPLRYVSCQRPQTLSPGYGTETFVSSEL